MWSTDRAASTALSAYDAAIATSESEHDERVGECPDE